MKHRVAIVGCGTVGTAFGRLLTKAGHTIVGIVTRHAETAKLAAKRVGAAKFDLIAWAITPDADVVFVTTPDDAIKATCDEISYHQGFKANAVVVHCSGALSSEVLASARYCSALVASLHPLQSFASALHAEQLVPGSFCAIEGDSGAISVVRGLAEDLGCSCMEIMPQHKVLYHAAAVAASNYLVTLINFAFELQRAAGIDPRSSCKALLPLVRGTLDNIEHLGIPQALTGPIARGDVDTVSAHLDAVARHAPQFGAMYRVLALRTIEIAKVKGTLSEEASQMLARLLERDS